MKFLLREESEQSALSTSLGKLHPNKSRIYVFTGTSSVLQPGSEGHCKPRQSWLRVCNQRR